MTWTRVNVVCEGQTEETFIKEVLAQYFNSQEIAFNPINLGGLNKKGQFHKFKRRIQNLCRRDSSAWVTTMVDYYGFPVELPGKSTPGSPKIKAKALMENFKEEIGENNFIPYIVLHEFEALLFSKPDAFSSWFPEDEVNELIKVRNNFESPELINDHSETAPSKRILNNCKNYDKIVHGTLISLEITLETIRKECPQFNDWIKQLENLKFKSKGLSKPLP